MASQASLSRKNGLATRLALWVALLTVLVISALGVYFDNFLRTSFLENTRTRMTYGFERLNFNLGQIESSLREGVAFLRVDEVALASVSLINLYEDRKRYNSFLLDEEKKALAKELLNKVKLSFNDDITLYGRNMDVIAYVARGDRGYHLNIVSYKEGKPRLLRRYEDDSVYSEVPLSLMDGDGITYQHINYYADEAIQESTQLTLHRTDRGLVVKSHLRLLSLDSGKPAAHIEMSRVLDSDYFLALSGNMNLDISVSDLPAAGVENVKPLREGKTQFSILEASDHYYSAMYLDTLGGRIFFNVSMERDQLTKALGQNRVHLLILLLVAVLFALFWIRFITVRRLRKPLEALMAQIGKIQQRDYSPTEVLESRDELQEVSESINQLARTVREREHSLQKSQKELEYLSDHDVLTGLANRRFWSRFLDRALQKADRLQCSAAVLFIDLDQFKQVNDIQGHDVGDKLLQSVASRLQSALSHNETLARIGGDEFNLLIENLSDAQQAESAARRIIELFEHPFSVAEQQINISASIGITLFPDDGNDSISLTKYADLAMYKAKENGRNNFCFFSEELSAQMKDRAELTYALRRALIDKSEFELYYQPKVSAFTGKIVAVEALIRWHHPDMGLVSPARFIPLAEELGLIIPLGEWVLEQGCRDYMRLVAAGIQLDHISINVSSIQLDNEDFPFVLDRVLKETGIDAHALELEITESYIAHQPDTARERLQYFRNRGVRLAVDDFGTGYSAMNTLQNLPVTRLKIDKSFVDGLPYDSNSVALARAIVSLAKNFNLALTAEGVENADQLAFLSAEECEEIQGYYFSKPLPYNDLVNYCLENSSENVLLFSTDL
ncbi:putative bifunctional diguanylate cyclase/phosphodiesterase [Oceanospirillum sanctuarii]|uniref:putative bifunctional diguanylate cyclase/phosphodiesterase n=1 Tax=Oceanospirillum sanctuarii TaxID=1434821 RepID=UPI000A3B6E95|nr:EAL domain-containing protein [Oceanospirillum sanctuarii]